jgi:hypothetical protein
MAEPLEELIKDAIRTRLAALVSDGGTTCWYTPTKVYRCGRKWHPSILVPELGTPEAPAVVYAIRSLPIRYGELASGRINGQLEVLILCARQEYRATTDPEREDSPREDLVAARMQRDVFRALLYDATGAHQPNLGGLVTNVIEQPGGYFEGENFEHRGWVVRVLHTVMPFIRPASTP